MIRLFINRQSHLKKDSGLAMPLVIMLLLVISILGLAAYTGSQSSFKQAAMLRPNLQAEYLARSAVDATIAAWTDEWINSPSDAPANAHFYSQYIQDESTGKWKFESFADNKGIKSDTDNLIETTLTFNAEKGTCDITATAEVGTSTATVTALSEGLLKKEGRELSPPWYDNGTKTTYPYILPNPEHVVSITRKISGTNRTAIVSYHYVDGIVNLTSTSDKGAIQTIYLDREKGVNGNNIDAIGLQAKRIIFNSPLNLYDKNSSKTLAWYSSLKVPQALGLTAETINFADKLTIGGKLHGNLSLRLPEGLGISGEKVYQNTTTEAQALVDLEARYGIVRFSDVEIKNTGYDGTIWVHDGFLSWHEEDNDNNPNWIKNKTFYFRNAYNEEADEEALSIGTDPSFIEYDGKSNPDCTFKTLIDEGYLIPCPNQNIANSDYDILFIYQ